MDAIYLSLIEEYQALDKSNHEEFREWLTKYSYLTIADYAKIAGVSTRTIRTWRRKVGIGPTIIRSVEYINAPRPQVLPQEVWDNREWFIEMAKNHGSHYIAKLTGRNRKTINDRIRRYKIKKRDYKEATKTKHPYFNKQWIEHHYVNNLKSAKLCAKLAGISPSTFIDWLLRLGIPVRSRHEASAAVGQNLSKQLAKMPSNIESNS